MSGGKRVPTTTTTKPGPKKPVPSNAVLMTFTTKGVGTGSGQPRRHRSELPRRNALRLHGPLHGQAQGNPGIRRHLARPYRNPLWRRPDGQPRRQQLPDHFGRRQGLGLQAWPARQVVQGQAAHVRPVPHHPSTTWLPGELLQGKCGTNW